MQKKISRRERLLALSLVFVMVFTSLSSSISMALSGTIDEAIEAEVASGSINWGFTLTDSNGKTYDATCMEPHNQSIPAAGNKVNLTTYSRDSVQAWIAYYGSQQYKGDTEKQQYIIARASARQAGNVNANNYVYTDEVNDLYNRAVKASGSNVPDASFRAYKADPANGSQDMLAWRQLKKSKIKLTKGAEEETDLSLAGAEYGLYATKAKAKAGKKDGSDALAVFVTRKNGTGYLKGTDTAAYTVPYFAGKKTFYVKELKEPDGFELDNSVKSKTIREGQTITFQVEDSLLTTGGLRVIKSTDIDHIPEGYDLAGAVYRAYSSEADAKADKNSKGEMVTKADGKSNTLKGLEAGKYYVKEVTPPKGFELDTEIHPVTVKADETVKVYSVDKAKNGRVGVQKFTDKTIPAGKSLAGAQYGVYVSHEAAEENPSDPELRIGILTTQENGYTGMLDFPPGEYVIKEFYCPSWLEMDGTAYDVTLKPGEDVTITSEDPMKMGKLRVQKLTNINPIPEGFTIAGAKYGVYDTYEHAQANGETGRLYTLTTDAAGTTETVLLEPGDNRTYYVREISCPDWLQLDTEIYPAVVDYGISEIITISSTDWIKPGYITLEKKSSVEPAPYSLEGAEYGIYLSEDDANANRNKVGTLVTDSNGKAKASAEVDAGKHYYVKEYKAPKNYELDQKVHPVYVDYGDYTTVTVTSVDTPYGKAQVLKSAAKDPFVLSECPQQYSLAGAEYGIYTDEDSANYFVDENRVATLTTKENGESNVVDLPQGTYWIIETKASPGFYKDGMAAKEITITPGGIWKHESKEVPMFDPITIVLDKPAGNSKENTPSLAGAEFKVEYYPKVVKSTSELAGMKASRTWYFETKMENGVGIIGLFDEYRVASKSDELYKDANGEPVGLIGSYVITETRAPKGYIPDTEPKLATVDETGTATNPSVSYRKPTVSNNPKEFKLHLEKQDSETGKRAQGDATLAGAVFGLYRDGKLIKEFTTGTDYTFTTPDYNIGDGSQVYTLKEIKAPDGYLPHSTEYRLDELEGDKITVQYTTVERLVKNTVIKGKFALTKVLNAQSETGALVPESGIQFQVYLTSAGSYEKALDSEKQLITTDKSGYAETKMLPYGNYTVHQVNTTEGHDKVSDFTFTIDKNNETERYTINNDEIDRPVRVIKKDSETGKIIPVAGAKFKVRRAGTTDDWISFTMMYPQDHVIDIFETDNSGTFKLPGNLPFGSYELVEIAPPEGYVYSDTPVAFKVDGTKDIVEVEKENDPQKGIIEVIKTGEILKSVTENADGSFTPVFDEGRIQDAVFEIFAKTDIVTPEGTVRYTAGEKVDTVTTGTDGTAVSKDLYLGEYEVKEVTAGENHVLNTDVFTAELVYDAQKVKVGDAVAVDNERQKASVSLVKGLETDKLYGYGSENHKDIAFGIYADEVITAEDGSSIPKDGLIEVTGVTEDGSAYSGIFACDLPHGSFYVQEAETAEGYILSDTKYPVNFDYTDQTVATVEIAVNDGNVIENKIIRGDIAGHKVSETDVDLSGAVIGLFKDGETEFTESTALLTDTSDTDGAFAFTDVAYGRYIVREIKAPMGYALNTTEYPVEITTDGQVIELDVVNEVTKFDIAKTDIATGEPVVGAQLAIIPLDSEGNPDPAQTFVTWITEDKEFRVEGLEVGKTYILRETLRGEAWDMGYVTAEDIEFTVPDTGEVQKLEMKDDFTKVDIAKTDIATGEPVVGAQLAIIPLDENGNPDVGATFETWITDDKEHRVERLPIGDYILRETLTGQAWDYGYVTAEDVKFTVTDTGEVQKVEMKDDYTKVEITKTDITTGDYVIGAQLSIIPLDEEGNPDVGAAFDTWLTEEAPHYIERIPVGKYILREKLTGLAWDYGYVTAEDVAFEVKDTPEIQKVDMDDDYTKVEITKTDITTGEPVVGAQLSIYPVDKNGKVSDTPVREWTTGEKPHRVEYLPVGDYVLREVLADAAKYGYVTAEDVKFTVADTPNVQKVEMKDDFTKLEITKADSVTNAGIPDTELSLFAVNANGEVSEKATASGTTDKDGRLCFEYVPVGDYILRETGTNFGLGYVTASDVPLKVMDTALVQTVTMKDDYTKVEVIKTDMETGQTVEGATLQILKKDGTVVKEFMSGTDAEEIAYLPVGEYVLRETKAPAGYVKSADMTFIVADTAEVQKFELKNNYIKVAILKKDAETEKVLPGAKLQLLDQDGNIVATWTSGEEAEQFERLAAGTYTLKELNAPDGYEIAEPVRIVIEETAEVQEYVMLNHKTVITMHEPAPAPEPEPLPKENSTPRTGDENHFIGWLTIALLGIGGVTAGRKRKKVKDN